MKHLFVGAAAALVLSACATTEGYQGAAGGCVAGAAFMALLGADAEDIAAGCAVGAAAGGLAGDYVGERRQKYESAEAFYEGEIDLIQQANRTLGEEIEEQDRQVAALLAANQELRTAAASETELKDALDAQRLAVDSQIEDLETQIAAIEGQIANSQTVVAAMREDEALEEAERLETALAAMEGNLLRLRSNYADLTTLQGTMAL